MGRQTIFFAMGMSAGSGIVMIIALCLPFHQMMFFSGGIVKIGSLKVWTAMGRITLLSDSDICHAIRAVTSEGDNGYFCNDTPESTDLLEMSQRFCAPTVDRLLKNSCTGMSNAYAFGVACIILCVINCVMQGVATWLLYHYMYNNPKKQYREVALILVTVGTSLVALALAGYFPLVSINLDNISTFGAARLAFSTSQGTGVSWGYWLMWVAVLIQTVQVVLYKFSKISDERRLVEMKMQEQFEAELAVNGMGGEDWGGEEESADPYRATGGFQQPPGYGAQQPPSWGVSPMSQPGYPPQQQPAYGQQQPAYGQQQQPAYGQQQPYPGYPAY